MSKETYFSKPSGKEELVLSVDLWKTGLHGKKVGMNQQEIYMAKSNQFTRDMNLIGEIKEKGAKDDEHGSIGVREEIVEDRLVLKAFSGSMTFLGTFEECPSLELVIKNSLHKNYPVFRVILPRYDFVVELRKVFGGFLKPEKYAFFMSINEEFNEFFTINQKRFARGDDWLVKNFKNEVVAKIDGKMFDIGGQWDVKIFSPNLAKEKEFLTLFAAFRRYEKSVMSNISKKQKSYEMGKFKPDNDEMTLYKNPRSKR
jgi:hypothetical protein